MTLASADRGYHRDVAERTTGADTKAALVRAAEHLMAKHGIEAAGLQDINRLAGQLNKTAVHYHFGDREGLLAAIGAKHREPINSERHRILDEIEQRRSHTLRDLIEAYVLPLASSLADPSGRDYIIIVSEGASRRGSRWLEHPERAHVDSLYRLIRLLSEAMPQSPTTKRELIGYTMLIVPVLLADIARDINNNNPSARAAAAAQTTSVVDFVTVGDHKRTLSTDDGWANVRRRHVRRTRGGRHANRSDEARIPYFHPYNSTARGTTRGHNNRLDRGGRRREWHDGGLGRA